MVASCSSSSITTAQGGSADAADSGTVDSGADDVGATNDAGAASACRQFKAGHYFRITDSTSRQQDGLAGLGYSLGKGGPDFSNFVGIVWQIDWSMLETAPGVYDFSRLDSALDKVKSVGKHLRVKIMDRTFWLGCDPLRPFAPSWVPVVPGGTGSKFCVATVWTQSAMDDFIALHIAIAKRYDNNDAFVGFTTEETATDVSYFREDWTRVYKELYPQRSRLAKELFAAVPDVLFISSFNWPVYDKVSYFFDMVDGSLVTDAKGTHNGMSITWPDSRLDSNNKALAYSWYQLARDRNKTVVVAPSIEGGVQLGTLAEGEALYQMLDTDIGAHMIVWDNWSAANTDYLRTVAIPTVQAHGGKLKNDACPFK